MILRLDNVERVADTVERIKKLKAKGYKVLPGTDAEKEDGPVKKPLEEMNIQELKELAKEKGLEGSSALKKEELLELLRSEA